jgi:PEGA domain
VEVIKTMKKVMLLVAAAVMAFAPMSASAARIFIGGGFYGPGPYSYWGPYPYGYGYYQAPPTGQVKIDTKSKVDEVYINGAFAGTTKDTKTFHLRPGDYNIEVRNAGQSEINEKVFVAAGKTIHLQPAL